MVYAIMMMGRTAAGKTTTARYLSKELDIEHILFSAYKRLVVNDDYLPQDSLREDLRDIGYKNGISYAQQRLRIGNAVILDASFHKIDRRLMAYAELTDVCQLLIRIYCRTSDIEKTRQRIQLRQGLEKHAQHHASSFAIFEYIDNSFDEPTIDETIGFTGTVVSIEIDTFSSEIVSKPPQPVLERFPVVYNVVRRLNMYLTQGG